MRWLFEAKKRFGLSMLNYMVTSNHIHLLARDKGARDVIPKSIQLIAGRTGQEYNQRKNRKGSFREDRYHATAVETAKYLIQCLVYMDMDMVRAGVVRHPSEWAISGHNEINAPHGSYELQEPPAPYKGILAHKNEALRPENSYIWDDNP
ncbi:MAG: transposase [Desulfatiglandaceae bacterium]